MATCDWLQEGHQGCESQEMVEVVNQAVGARRLRRRNKSPSRALWLSIRGHRLTAISGLLAWVPIQFVKRNISMLPAAAMSYLGLYVPDAEKDGDFEH